MLAQGGGNLAWILLPFIRALGMSDRCLVVSQGSTIPSGIAGRAGSTECTRTLETLSLVRHIQSARSTEAWAEVVPAGLAWSMCSRALRVGVLTPPMLQASGSIGKNKIGFDLADPHRPPER